ncbi:fungal-specific transcription factor domain-containing protein [Xylariales sp. PMI_506]|nr:fungal-specific transcription factor domain-containing protein [Xylariales sp. PMI_506]
MPPGRPAKRSSDLESDGQQIKCKLPKLDRTGGANNDFSSVVKSKLSSYTRTGQACDRCKVRKIRCDALAEGCSHCINQNLDCYVTDRVTGRTERRGYMQQLEREKNDMLNRIQELEKLLTSHGVQVKPWERRTLGDSSSAGYPADVSPPYELKDGIASEADSPNSKLDWTQMSSSVWPKDSHPKSRFGGVDRSVSELKLADVHLGVGTDRAPLSSIKGTTLSILGSTIDIRSVDAPDMDEPAPGAQARSPLYNKSMQAMMQSCTNVNPQLHVEYPPRADAFIYAEWYFLMIYPFLPVLHKPTFMTLLTRLYDDPNFKPTVAEVVMVHMVFASIYLQYGTRNRENAEQKARLNDLSNKHYHFSLSKYFDLCTSKTLDDLQALTMIAVHTRCFPKPDCSSMIGWACLGMAVELGLHKALRKPGEGTNLENEMRKRIWWTILAINVTLNGRMGKPMPIRLEETDVECPEMIADELLTKDGVDSSRTGKCLYEMGVVSYRLVGLFLDLYSNIYCAKRNPSVYVQVVHDLEARLEVWKQELPEELRTGDGTESQYEVFSLWVEYMGHEFRLCLRHPSVAMTNDPKMMAENSRLCEQAAKDMLSTVWKLYKLRSLDHTWYAHAEYIAAMLTSLVSVWERRFETTAAEMDSLRNDMNSWLTILADTCDLIGGGTGLRDSVASIVERTMAWIEQDRPRKDHHVSSAPPPAPMPQTMIKQSPPAPGYSNMSEGQVHANTGDNRAQSHRHGGADGAIASTSTIPNARVGFYEEVRPETTQYQQTLAYNGQSTHNHSHGTLDYHTENHYMYGQAAAQAQVPPHTPISGHNPMSSYATQGHGAAPEMSWRHEPTPVGNTWQDWTAAVDQDRYSANALMALGAAPRPTNTMNDGGAAGGPGDPSMGMAVGMNGATVPTTAAMQWPLLLFHDGSAGVGGA